MTGPALRPILPADRTWVRALNEAHALETSSLTTERLAHLLAMAWYAKAAGGKGAFLLAFDQTAPYDNANFAWMNARFEHFVYVDRVVTAASHRRQGLARSLYEDLIAAARAAGYPRITCEVNADPPNLQSDVFHERMGFRPVGDLRSLSQTKAVRYLSLELDRTSDRVAHPYIRQPREP